MSIPTNLSPLQLLRGLSLVLRSGDCRISVLGGVVIPSAEYGYAIEKIVADHTEMLQAIETIIFQVVQGKVLERDACITQARAAIQNAKGAA